jgi:hypothetical protein
MKTAKCWQSAMFKYVKIAGQFFASFRPWIVNLLLVYSDKMIQRDISVEEYY